MGADDETLAEVMSEQAKEEIAIIKDIHFGFRDDEKAPYIWFDAKTLHGDATIRIPFEKITDFMHDWKCYKLSDLNGKACRVTLASGIMTYVRKAF